MKTSKTAKIVLCTIVGIEVLYALLYVIYSFKHSNDIMSAVSGSVPIVFICGVMSLILLLSAFGGWSKLMRRLGRGGDAAAYEESAAESKNAYENVRTKYEDKQRGRKAARDAGYSEYKLRRASKPSLNRKNLIIAAVIFAICAAVAGVMFWLYSQQANRFDSDSYVKTTAIVMRVQTKNSDEAKLAYVYYDEEGKPYVYKSTGTFSGVSFKEGKEITVYYNKYNPEITLDRSAATGMLMAAVFFLSGGVLVLLLNIFRASNVIVPIIVGGLFVFFAVGMSVSVSLAGGLSFVETLFSGPLVYGTVSLGIVGCLFVLFGVFSIFREIYYFCRYLKNSMGDRKTK